MTGVELVRLGQAEIRSREIGRGAVGEPLAMRPPLAARRDRPVGDQDLQNVVPARSLPARRQGKGPEPIEFEFPPQRPGQPTVASLARMEQARLRQAKWRHRGVVRDRVATILGEQGQRLRSARVGVDELDRLAPSFRPRRVDLAQIQNAPLRHSAAIETLVLDDAPIKVRLAVAPSLVSSREHDDAEAIAKTNPGESGRSSLRAVLPILTVRRKTKSITYDPKNRKTRFSDSESAKSG